MLDRATEEVDRLDDAAVRAKGRHRVCYAKAFLDSTGPMDSRHQQAILQCEVPWFEFELADQKVRACKERIRTIRDQIDLHRSLGAAVRSEWAASGMTNE